MQSIELIGPMQRIQSRIQQLYRERPNRAFLLYGPPASGKMTMALTQAKILNCQNNKKHDNKKHDNPNIPCNQCSNCKKIQSFTHPDVQVVDDHSLLEKLEQFSPLLLSNPPLTQANSKSFQTLLLYLEAFFHQVSQILSQFFSTKQLDENPKKMTESKEEKSSQELLENIIQNICLIRDSIQNMDSSPVPIPSKPIKKQGKPKGKPKEKKSSSRELLEQIALNIGLIRDSIQTMDSSLSPISSKSLDKQVKDPLQKILENAKKLYAKLQKQGLINYLNIETLRSLLRYIQIKPMENDCFKVLILRVFLKEPLNHLLLKILEELPSQSTVILITEQLETIRPTVRSRCLLFRTRTPSLEIQKTILHEKWGLSLPIHSYQSNLWNYFPNPKKQALKEFIQEFETHIPQYRQGAWLMNFVEKILKKEYSASTWLKAILESIQNAKKEKYLSKNPSTSLSMLPNQVLDELFLEGSKLLETVAVLNLNPSMVLTRYLIKIATALKTVS